MNKATREEVDEIVEKLKDTEDRDDFELNLSECFYFFLFKKTLNNQHHIKGEREFDLEDVKLLLETMEKNPLITNLNLGL